MIVNMTIDHCRRQGHRIQGSRVVGRHLGQLQTLLLTKRRVVDRALETGDEYRAAVDGVYNAEEKFRNSIPGDKGNTVWRHGGLPPHWLFAVPPSFGPPC